MQHIVPQVGLIKNSRNLVLNSVVHALKNFWHWCGVLRGNRALEITNLIKAYLKVKLLILIMVCHVSIRPKFKKNKKYGIGFWGLLFEGYFFDFVLRIPFSNLFLQILLSVDRFWKWLTTHIICIEWPFFKQFLFLLLWWAPK